MKKFEFWYCSTFHYYLTNNVQLWTGLKDSAHANQLDYVISYFSTVFSILCMCPKIRCDEYYKKNYGKWTGPKQAVFQNEGNVRGSLTGVWIHCMILGGSINAKRICGLRLSTTSIYNQSQVGILSFASHITILLLVALKKYYILCILQIVRFTRNLRIW